MARMEVKQTRVIYLELAVHEKSVRSREKYNDAVVKIFTGLNAVGRTLTCGDITFARLKYSKLLNNDELAKGGVSRAMAANVFENLPLVVEAVASICEKASDRELRFQEHYQSVNALACLWAWYFAALRWWQERKPEKLKRNSIDKSLNGALELLLDRWLICSQWAGV